MRPMSDIVGERLYILSVNQNLLKTIDAVEWRPSMRMRVILELDIEEDGVRLHGFEFRYRRPDLRIIPGSEWREK